MTAFIMLPEAMAYSPRSDGESWYVVDLRALCDCGCGMQNVVAVTAIKEFIRPLAAAWREHQRQAEAETAASAETLVAEVEEHLR